MIHIVINHDPQDSKKWIATDVDCKPPRVIYQGDNIFAAERARQTYIAQQYQT